VLRKSRFEAAVPELVDAKRAYKEAAIILHRLGMNEPRTVKTNCFKPHD
jgi:hypothetical protein